MWVENSVSAAKLDVFVRMIKSRLDAEWVIHFVWAQHSNSSSFSPLNPSPHHGTVYMCESMCLSTRRRKRAFRYNSPVVKPNTDKIAHFILLSPSASSVQHLSLSCSHVIVCMGIQPSATALCLWNQLFMFYCFAAGLFSHVCVDLNNATLHMFTVLVRKTCHNHLGCVKKPKLANTLTLCWCPEVTFWVTCTTQEWMYGKHMAVKQGGVKKTGTDA